MNVERRRHNTEPEETCRKEKPAIRQSEGQLYWKLRIETISRRGSSIMLAVLGNSDKDSEVFTGLSEKKVLADLGSSNSIEYQERNQFRRA